MSDRLAFWEAAILAHRVGVAATVAVAVRVAEAPKPRARPARELQRLGLQSLHVVWNRNQNNRKDDRPHLTGGIHGADKMRASLAASSDHQTRDMEHPEDEQALPEDDPGVPRSQCAGAANATSRGIS